MEIHYFCFVTKNNNWSKHKIFSYLARTVGIFHELMTVTTGIMVTFLAQIFLTSLVLIAEKESSTVTC